MLDYSETSENVYLAFNQHIRLTNKKFENLVHLTFKGLARRNSPNQVEQPRQRTRERRPICYTCGRVGHIQQNCDQRSSRLQVTWKSKPEIRQHLVTSPLDPSKPTEDEVNDPPQSQEKQDVPFPNAVRRTKSRITADTDVIVELCTEGIIERSSDPDPSLPQHSASAGSESTAVNKDSFYTRSHPDHR